MMRMWRTGSRQRRMRRVVVLMWCVKKFFNSWIQLLQSKCFRVCYRRTVNNQIFSVRVLFDRMLLAHVPFDINLHKLRLLLARMDLQCDLDAFARTRLRSLQLHKGFVESNIRSLCSTFHLTHYVCVLILFIIYSLLWSVLRSFNYS